MKMKKILAAVLAGVMTLSATACSSSSTKKIESPDDFAGAKVSVQTGHHRPRRSTENAGRGR